MLNTMKLVDLGKPSYTIILFYFYMQPRKSFNLIIIVMTGLTSTMVLVMPAQPSIVNVVGPKFHQQFFQAPMSCLLNSVRMNLFHAADLKSKWITVCMKKHSENRLMNCKMLSISQL